MAKSSDSTTPSPSPGSSSGYGGITEPSPPGRPKRSFVWKYFVYDKDNNKSVCQINVNRDHGDRGGPSLEKCAVAITGKYPTLGNNWQVQ